MSSSTFSSRDEWKVLVLVILSLLGAEFGVLRYGSSISLDVKHLVQLPEISRAYPKIRGPRALILGNSMARVGIDVGLLSRELALRGVGPITFVKVIPDGACIPEWYYLLKHNFKEQQRPLDNLFIFFTNAHISDVRAPQPRRLGLSYASIGNIPEMFACEVTDFRDRCDLLISHISMLYARQEEIKRRLLDLAVPHFRDTELQVNATIRRGKEKSETHLTVKDRGTYTRLERLLAMLREQGTNTVFVALPVRGTGELDEAVPSVVRRWNAEFVDARSIIALRGDDFSDELHMNPAAAELYTRALAGSLLPYMKKICAGVADTRSYTP